MTQAWDHNAILPSKSVNLFKYCIQWSIVIRLTLRFSISWPVKIISIKELEIYLLMALVNEVPKATLNL